MNHLLSQYLILGCPCQEVDEAGRLEALHRFQEGKVSILLCSDLLSRGIDTSKAAVVVNYEFPNNTRCGFNECLL